jgi:hypothetical protein
MMPGKASAQDAPGAPSSCPQGYATVFTNCKAGMDGVDKEKVKQVVYEMSKDSPHFLEEQKKQVRHAASAVIDNSPVAPHKLSKLQRLLGQEVWLGHVVIKHDWRRPIASWGGTTYLMT